MSENVLENTKAEQMPKRKRDAEVTKQRILDVAMEEFGTHGLAGARVDRVSQAADVSVRMLYHYFGSKDELYRAVLAAGTRRRAESIHTSSIATSDLGELFVRLNHVLTSDPQYLRLILWEAMDGGDDDDIVLLEEREALYRIEIDRLRVLQAEGEVAADLEPDLIWLLAVIIGFIPTALPQITRIITGTYPSDRAFVRRWSQFIRAIGNSLAMPANDDERPAAGALH